MSNRFRVIVSIVLCVCSISTYAYAAPTKKSQSSSEESTQNKNIHSKNLLTLEKAERVIRKFYPKCTLRSGVLQEGNRAYVWAINMGGYGLVSLLFEFHHYNDGRWVLHSNRRQSDEMMMNINNEPVE